MKKHAWVGVVMILAVLASLHVYSQDAQTDKPKSEFAEARAKLIGALAPASNDAFESALNDQGDYVYEATSAKALVDGVPMTLSPDTPVKGLTTIGGGRRVTEGNPRLNGVYWRLKGVQTGKYWVGVVFQTAPTATVWRCPLRTSACSTSSSTAAMCPAIPTATRCRFRPACGSPRRRPPPPKASRKATSLSIVANGSNLLVPTARLILHSKEPVRGTGRLRVNPGPNIWNQATALGISADGEFIAQKGKPVYGCLQLPFRYQLRMESPADLPRTSDGKAIARCSLANPLPAPVEVDYVCVVKGYYLQEAGRDEAAPDAGATFFRDAGHRLCHHR